MIKKELLASLLIVSISVSAKEVGNPPYNLSNEDKLYGLSLFWKEASYNFAYFDQVPDLDFDSAYREYIPKVLATETTYEYYRELMKFNALLHDGHTNIYLPKGLSSKYVDWPALSLREAHQIPLGSTVVSVEGINLETHLKTNIMPYIASSTEHILWND